MCVWVCVCVCERERKKERERERQRERDREREREKEGKKCFIFIFYLWLYGIRHMVKVHSYVCVHRCKYVHIHMHACAPGYLLLIIKSNMHNISWVMTY